MSTRVLLADDLAFMRMVQREILKGEGFTVVGEASNGLEAVSLFAELRPDLTILDLSLIHI